LRHSKKAIIIPGDKVTYGSALNTTGSTNASSTTTSTTTANPITATTLPLSQIIAKRVFELSLTYSGDMNCDPPPKSILKSKIKQQFF